MDIDTNERHTNTPRARFSTPLAKGATRRRSVTLILQRVPPPPVTPTNKRVIVEEDEHININVSKGIF
jgi:hypothetical protein